MQHACSCRSLQATPVTVELWRDLSVEWNRRARMQLPGVLLPASLQACRCILEIGTWAAHNFGFEQARNFSFEFEL